MIRLKITVVVIGLACAVGYGLFLYGVVTERARIEAETNEDYREGRQDADEALDDVRGIGGAEWLRQTFGGQGGGNP